MAAFVDLTDEPQDDARLSKLQRELTETERKVAAIRQQISQLQVKNEPRETSRTSPRWRC